MRPHFLFHSPKRAAAPIPPTDFIPARNPSNVRLINYTHSPQRRSASRRAGIRYEKKWHTFAGKVWPTYRNFQGQLFAFSDVSGQRCCSPDGVLIPLQLDYFVIFEVKVGHISDSFWQLRRLYEPVLSQWSDCRGRRPVVVEVCRRFDPAIIYPGRAITLNLFELDDYFQKPQSSDEVGVLIWKDK
jgi:hypothetical protein